MMHTEWEEVIFVNWTLKRFIKKKKWNKIIAVYVVPSKQLFSSLWNGLEQQTDGPIRSMKCFISMVVTVYFLKTIYMEWTQSNKQMDQ